MVGMIVYDVFFFLNIVTLIVIFLLPYRTVPYGSNIISNIITTDTGTVTKLKVTTYVRSRTIFFGFIGPFKIVLYIRTYIWIQVHLYSHFVKSKIYILKFNTCNCIFRRKKVGANHFF